ncbi:MAG: restriction endonuclease [Bacilli bacterium]|nr:restriction endonuclease [Bacilli bacterium]
MKLTTEISTQIINKIEEAKNLEEVANILKEYSKYELKGAQLGRAFEKMFIQDEGFSPYITMEELERYHHSFHTTNGGDWCRSDSSYLGKKYTIARELRGGKIFAIKTDGFNKKRKINQSIRSDILKEIQGKRCAILDINTNIECDHKDGMKDDWRLNNKDNQRLEDFQPLTKTANDAKRQHCKKCLETGKRYDAKRLGYKESYILGDSNSKTCVGCYWYDPIKFNQKISENFDKKA